MLKYKRMLLAVVFAAFAAPGHAQSEENSAAVETIPVEPIATPPPNLPRPSSVRIAALRWSWT